MAHLKEINAIPLTVGMLQKIQKELSIELGSNPTISISLYIDKLEIRSAWITPPLRTSVQFILTEHNIGSLENTVREFIEESRRRYEEAIK